MKKNLIVIVMLLALSPVFGVQEPAVKAGPADLVASTAVLYAETSEIGKSLPVARYFIKNFLPEKKQKEVSDWSAEFRKKTGVDPLDELSLSKAGVDISRSVCFAYLESGEQSERILIFIPVKNEKTFPLKFVDILKKYNKDKPGADLSPAVTKYKNSAVYQVQKDVFFTSINGYLAVASSGALLHGLIDRNREGTDEAPAATLASDPLFKSFRSRLPGCNDLNVFFKKGFMEGRLRAPGKGAGQAQVPGELEFMEYLALGVKKEGSGVSLQFGVSFERKSREADVFMKLLAPVKPDRFLPAEGALSYHYISFDLKALSDLCTGADGKSLRMCSEYGKFISAVEKETGLALERDFIPYFRGYVNVAARKALTAGTMDNFVVYIPMTDEGKAVSLWKGLRSAVKEKYSGEESFGEEKIDAVPSFWFKDKKEIKISFIAFNKGLYAGNNMEFLRTAMSGSPGLPDIPVIECAKAQDAAVVLLSYLKIDSESYLKALLMLLTYNVNPHLYGLVNRIDYLSVVGKREDNYFSLNLTTTLLPDKAGGQPK
jgi:hypothetical protein